MTTWLKLHPGAAIDHGGLIFTFIDAADPRPAREQFNERYVYGGWQPFGDGRFKLLEGLGLEYPEDPVLAPLWATRVGDEIVVIYSASVVAIIQPGGSFEVARLD
jgi:hypothetical protein